MTRTSARLASTASVVLEPGFDLESPEPHALAQRFGLALGLGLHAVDVALRGDHRLAHPPVEALPLLQLAPESGLALAQRGTAGLGLVERAREVLEELVDRVPAVAAERPPGFQRTELG